MHRFPKTLRDVLFSKCLIRVNTSFPEIPKRQVCPFSAYLSCLGIFQSPTRQKSADLAMQVLKIWFTTWHKNNSNNKNTAKARDWSPSCFTVQYSLGFPLNMKIKVKTEKKLLKFIQSVFVLLTVSLMYVQLQWKSVVEVGANTLQKGSSKLGSNQEQLWVVGVN